MKCPKAVDVEGPDRRQSPKVVWKPLGKEVGSPEVETGVRCLLGSSEDRLICYEMVKNIMLKERSQNRVAA